MTTDLKAFSPLVPIIDNSKSSYSISLNRNDNNNNNSETNPSNSIRTISFKDLSRQILNNKNSRLPHTNTFILTDSSGKKYALKTASNNMTGSTATFSANTTANSNTINNSNTNNNNSSNNNSNPNSAGTNQKSSEMANQNIDNNNNNNNSGGSNSTTTTMSEMVNAIEELRRENERIINELGATQEMLDLFERYRELIHKHMDNCICAGKDHFFNQWKRMEVDYVNLLPSSNRKRFKNESSAIHQQDPSSLFDMNRHSNQLMLKNPKLRGNFPPQNFQSRLNGMKRSNHHFYSPHSNPKFDVTLRMVNNTEHSNNHAHHHVIDNVNSSSTSYSQPRHSMGGTKVGGGGAKVGGKSLVRTFLDKIRPVNSINGFNKFPSSSLMLNSQSHSSSYQPPPPVSFISQGSNILIRKRSAAYPHEIFYNKNGSFSKKFRQDPSSALRISALNANGNKKHSKNDRHTSSAADQEVERLDKLNNALDQILLGRFDALAQLETNNSHDEHHLDNDEDLSRAFAANSLIMDCDLHQDDEDEDDDVDDDESDANEEGEDREEDEDDDDENDSNHQQNIKNNVIVMKSNHNQNGLKEELNDEDDNIDEVDDEQEDSDSQIHSAKAEQSTILSAVLKSGLKPYNNFRKMNGNMINNKNGQIATIQVNPTTVLPVAQIKITNNNVMKENSLAPVAFTNNNSKSTIDLHQPPPPKPVSPSPQGFRQRPHLTNEERTDIINRLKSNESGARIARDYGITKQAVSAIKRRAQLMGDNFQSKYYTTPSPAPMASSSQQTSGNVPKNQSSPILTTPVIITTTTVGPNSQQAVQQQPSLVDKQPIGPSTITINLATTSTGGFSFVDNSLVSRQLKQQKVNATIMKQSNLLAQLPRSTSDLVLPVNTVAILKSKIAAQQKQQQANPITAALLNNSLSANTNLKTNIEVDQKRLILPRLLQGTEAYTPTYVTTNNSNNTSVNARETAEPDEDADNNNDQRKEEVNGDSEKNPQTPNRDNNEGDSNDEENIQEPDHDSDENHTNDNDEESEEEEEEEEEGVNQDIKDNNADDDNFNQDDCIEISDGEDHSDDDQDEPESAAIDDPTDETSQEHPESNDDEREDFEDDDDAQHGGDVQESHHQIEQVPGDSSDEKDRSADGSEHMIQDGEDLPASSSPSFENSLQSMEFISE